MELLWDFPVEDYWFELLKEGLMDMNFKPSTIYKEELRVADKLVQSLHNGSEKLHIRI